MKQDQTILGLQHTGFENLSKDELRDLIIQLLHSNEESKLAENEKDTEKLKSLIKKYQTRVTDLEYLVKYLNEVKIQLEEKQQELDLANSRYELAGQASKEGLWEITIPDNLEIDEDTPIWYSPQFARLLGFEPHEFSYKISTWSTRIHPNHKKEIFRVYADFIKGLAKDDIFDVDTLLQTKSGEYRWFNAKSKLIRDENGKPLREAGVLTDIHDKKLLDEALKISESHLKTILENTKQGFWDWDAQTKNTYYSDEYYLMLGYQPNEFKPSYEKWASLLHPDERESVEQAQKDFIEGKAEDYDIEFRMLTKNEGYKWFLTKGNIIERDEKGKAIRVLGIVNDIDKHKKAEQELRESRRRLQLALEVAQEGVWEWNSLTNQIYHSPEFFHILGYEENEFEPTYEHWVQSVHPEDRGTVVELERQYINNEIPEFNYEYRMLTKNEGYKWFLSRAKVLARDKKGRATHILGVIKDIDERKKFEQNLTETNEELSASEEELRQNAEELISINEALELVKKQLEITLESEKKANKRSEEKGKALYIQKKELRKSLRQLKETQKQLIQSEKMASLGVLVAGVAHEINNPINYVSNSIEALKNIMEEVYSIIQVYDTINPQNVRKKLNEIDKLKKLLDYEGLIDDTKILMNNIREGAEQTAKIVKGLRSFSRMDEGFLEPADVNKLIDNSLLILQNEYKYHIEIIKNFGEIPVIFCHPHKLNQVFVNILINAIQSINQKGKNEQGKIYIKTSFKEKIPNNFIIIEIADNGVGIAQKIKNRIFEPFFTTKEVGSGTGLGLSISLGIIENHQGEIEVFSEPGKGAKFLISLPDNLQPN